MNNAKPNFGPGVDPGPNRRTTRAVEVFDNLAHVVNNERGAVYGHPLVDFGRASAIKSVIADCPDPRLRHVLDMIAVKMCRLIETPDHVDSWVDIAGYARTACMVIDAQEVGYVGREEG